MKLSSTGSRVVPLAFACFAASLLSCAVEVVEESAMKAAGVAEPLGGTLVDESRQPGIVNVGGPRTNLAYVGGTTLMAVHDPKAERVDPFAFALEGPTTTHVRTPDFSAVLRRGYDFGYSSDDFFRSPVYATTSTGDVYYFEGYTRHQGPTAATFGYAVVIAHASPDRDAEVFDVSTSAYAFFPKAVLVRGRDDAFVGAATVKRGTFGPDFPGCPSTIVHSKNGVYLAHLDAMGVHELAFPGEGPLDAIAFGSDGALVVDTGASIDDADPHEERVSERWTTKDGVAWTRLSRSVAPPSRD